MEFRLIPVPKRLTVTGGGSVLRLSTLHARLSLPEDDGRLTRRAAAIFGSVAASTVSDGEYILCAGSDRAPEPPENAEGYSLSCAAGGVCLRSISAAGLFRGMNTLCQLASGGYFPPLEIADFPDIPLRADHFDLRYVHPSYEALRGYIREAAFYGFNAVMIEYEDKLPFAGLSVLRSPDAISPEQLSALEDEAYENFIQIIPLQQSFAHLEYVLRRPEYAFLREKPDSPGELCPLRAGAFELACSLIDDTAALHPHSEYIHLGCDEAWSLGASPECRASGLSREEISIEYINRLALHVISLGKTPIVWFDMFANGSAELLDRLDKNVIVAVWIYDDLRVRDVAPAMLNKLSRAGLRYFICPASQCNDGALWQNYPRIGLRLRDTDAWAGIAAGSGACGWIQTSWLINYTLGRPYGLFETTRFISYYGSARAWNAAAPADGLLASFISLYYGINELTGSDAFARNEDWFRLMPSLADKAVKNTAQAKAVGDSVRFEGAAQSMCTMFRSELYPTDDTELTNLEACTRRDLQGLYGLIEDLRKQTDLLMEPAMSRVFIMSRVYPYILQTRRLQELFGPGWPDFESLALPDRA